MIHGDGEQSRDFAYIDDVVQANLRAARRTEHAYGRAFNVGGGGEPTSVNRLLGRSRRSSASRRIPSSSRAATATCA